MRALYDFIVEPVGNRYENIKQVAGKNLYINTNIENHNHVSRLAKVLSTPVNIDTSINVGDIIVIHHNIFRRYYDIRGEEKNSRSYFKDNKYFVSIDQIFLYHKNKRWNSFLNRCFIKPLKQEEEFSTSKKKKNFGVVRYGNEMLEKLQVEEGDIVSYKNKREFEFVIGNELLYCMKSNDILLNHGCKKDEEEYNPSWANSS